MEPVLPVPHVVVIGNSPAVATLAGLVVALNWRSTVVHDGGERGELADNIGFAGSLVEWVETLEAPPMGVVVATQGHYDEPALEAALASGSSYVGLVASATRATTVLGYLKDRGATEADIARIKTPAGLDLGHIEHREIGVAIMAELVRWKSSTKPTDGRGRTGYGH